MPVRLGVARTTVQERIHRLERDGVIAGYTVRVSDDFARQRITAQVLINVDPKAGERVVRELEARPWVRAVYALSGVFDYEVRLEGGSTESSTALSMRSGGSTASSERRPRSFSRSSSNASGAATALRVPPAPGLQPSHAAAMPRW